jgi:hypothetical protein
MPFPGDFAALLQVDVTSKTEGKVDNSHMLVKYDARLRDNVAAGVVAEVTDTVQVRSAAEQRVAFAWPFTSAAVGAHSAVLEATLA